MKPSSIDELKKRLSKIKTDMAILESKKADAMETLSKEYGLTSVDDIEKKLKKITPMIDEYQEKLDDLINKANEQMKNYE